jgi:TctA family transporter
VRLAGDAVDGFALVRAGGLGNALALAAFIASTASAVIRGRRQRASA